MHGHAVLACQEKANYLLKFSGVSRVVMDKMDNACPSPRCRPAWASKGKNWNKISTAVTAVGKLKQHVRWGKTKHL